MFGLHACMTPIEQLPDDPAELKSLLSKERALLSRKDALIDALRLETKQLNSELVRLRRQTFGRKSERLQEEDPNQLLLFEEKDSSGAAKDADDTRQKESSKPQKRQNRRKGGKGRQAPTAFASY